MYLKEANSINSLEKSVKKITIALAGNPNVGKTTVFNALTGSKQHTGNWPGVTVERKEGYFEYDKVKAIVVDLPGIYGLNAYSLDERITREFLISERPDVTVVVVDASNIERNLYLVIELLELELNLIIALNMMDDVKKEGINIDIEGLSKYFNVPVVPMVAVRGEGIKKLKQTILSSIENPKKGRVITYPEHFEKSIIGLQDLINEVEFPDFWPSRWFAIKLLEKDPEITNMAISKRIPADKLNDAITSLERQFKEDSTTILSEMRYSIIHRISKKFIKRTITVTEKTGITDKLDKFFTNRFLGIPIFFLFMWLTFQVTFSVGGYFAEWIDLFFGWLGDTIAANLAGISPTWLISLLKDGIIGGVGSVIVFLPNIFLLFLAIAFLEDTGYMARAAFIMDRLMHAMGLHGKSFIPMILGFGCNVPAIMATRTLESEKDRVLTILVNPLMSCSARLPIYTLFAAIFFSKHQGLVIFSMYVIGIALAILMARLFKGLFFKTESTPLIMELPPYRMPSIKNIFQEATLRSSVFLKKAGTIILLVVVIVWLLSSLPFGVEYGSENSLIGQIGKFIAPVFKPLGFGFWQAGVALIFGTLAKEVVVGTFGTLFGEATLTQSLSQMFTPLSAYSFMLFSLIYIPCIATLAVIWKEAGKKWALFTLIYLPVLAYTLSALVYQIGRLL